MNVTMRDLGKRLGVSAVTVSKALAGKSGVSEEMRQKIIRLANDLGYVNPNAQPERKDKGLDVGILVPDMFFSNESFYAMLYKLLVRTLTDAGHFGLLELLTEDMQASLALPNILRSRRVDAIILLGQPRTEYTRMLVRQGVPVVCVDFYEPDLQVDAVVGDSICGAAELTRHLIAMGHREIAFVGDVKATSSIMERHMGYASTLLVSDLPVRQEYILSDRDEHGRLLPLILPQRRPTALVCNCDWVARWVIDQLRQQGLRVPEDVSIVGFDDFNYTPATVPPLTTFRVDTTAMCSMAVQLVKKRCGGDKSHPVRIVVGGECVLRQSVRDLNEK